MEYNNQTIPRYTAYTAYVASAISHSPCATTLAYVGHELESLTANCANNKLFFGGTYERLENTIRMDRQIIILSFYGRWCFFFPAMACSHHWNPFLNPSKGANYR